MSEPVNDFLEAVEACVQATGTTDEALGKTVRVAWTAMLKAEEVEKTRMDNEFKTRIINADDKLVQVTIPSRR